MMSDSSGPSRNRAHSANSQRLSLDSLEGQDRRNEEKDSEDAYDDVSWNEIEWDLR